MKWAVRILRLTGWLMQVPGCIPVPIVLLILLPLGIKVQLNDWKIDWIGWPAGFPVILGKSILVGGDGLGRSHSVGRAHLNPANEWKHVVGITFQGTSVIASIGSFIWIVRLAFGKLMNSPVPGNWIQLALKVALAGYLAPSRFSMVFPRNGTNDSDQGVS